MLPIAAPAAAQLGLEVRAGAAVGHHVPAHSGLGTTPGLSLSGSLEVRPLAFASLYASYARAAFQCAGGFCTGNETTVQTQGFGGGVRLHPSGLPWLRAGMLLYGTSLGNGEHSTALAPVAGYEVGAGFSLPFGTHARLLPGVYFRTQPGEERTTLLGADIGLQLSF